ncbi:MAG: Single-stranded DNA-binding protein [Parcubacteria group bacterium GW2011_GWC1_42_11]|nr:MAG: Single-stranded DNA-binding protein [Parcubacteria group bacterium GW2011_GWC1_42_11]KKT08648.1 MAG: Single-stranded DNA-binding protein [Candidatus Nomurabacteria bacterium GW2011_GWB1_43_20]HBH71259.1 single-stranded DNA-binding protein [Candidatus Yonathbacteria bacterium]
MYINKAMVYGNLTRDPEMKALPSGQQVTSFSLATNRVWKDKSGVKQESVDYHNIVMFAKLAELAAQYLKKGSAVFIEGRMQTRSWDDPTGKKYRTEIVADTMQFGPRASGATASGGYTQATSSAKSSTPVPQPEALETIEYPQEDINPDDIPF